MTQDREELIERLQVFCEDWHMYETHVNLAGEAAQAITSLLSDLEAMQEALSPIIDTLELWSEIEDPESRWDIVMQCRIEKDGVTREASFTPADLKRARQALSKEPEVSTGEPS